MKGIAQTWGAVILAAGKGERLGAVAKPLIEWQGETLLERAVKAVREAGASEVVVVTGAFDAKIRERLPALIPLMTCNERWAEGMGSSVAHGATTLLAKAPKLSALLVMPSDLPFVTSALFQEYLGYFAGPEGIVATAHGPGQAGAPVLFGRRHFAAVKAFSGKVPGRDYLASQGDNLVCLEKPELSLDLDTQADLQRLKSSKVS